MIELHLQEYFQRKFEYLDMYQRYHEKAASEVIKRDFAELGFGLPEDIEGYHMNVITHDLISDVYLEFTKKTRVRESENYLRTLTGQ